MSEKPYGYWQLEMRAHIQKSHTQTATKTTCIHGKLFQMPKFDAFGAKCAMFRLPKHTKTQQHEITGMWNNYNNNYSKNKTQRRDIETPQWRWLWENCVRLQDKFSIHTHTHTHVYKRDKWTTHSLWKGVYIQATATEQEIGALRVGGRQQPADQTSLPKTRRAANAQPLKATKIAALKRHTQRTDAAELSWMWKVLRRSGSLEMKQIFFVE